LLALPDSLPRLTNLTSLRVSNNEITALPIEIGGFVF
jgi:Leucine-rich repeat (LRR) protein